MVPVLVLMTVFVLWAGRAGRAALTADLAAEEAATAAALCCEETEAGAPDREALVEDVLEARPGLGFLCVGGLRPVPPENGVGPDGVGPDGFVREHWLEFEPGSDERMGGVGVLGVQFSCESDGAVAPMRGLFPTVTFHGQASEVVLREPPAPGIRFAQTTFSAIEGNGARLVFRVTSGTPVPVDVSVDYYVIDADTTATDPSDANPPDNPADYSTVLSGSVPILAGENSAEIIVILRDDGRYEGTEYLVLKLDPDSVNPAGLAQVDITGSRAVGEISDNDPPPYLFISGPQPSEEVEGGRRISETQRTPGTLTFQVRLRDESNITDAPSASPVTVDVLTEHVTTTDSDYTPVDTTLTFDPGDVTIDVAVQTLDDLLGEATETFILVLENPRGAPLGTTAAAVGSIIDDEAGVWVANVSATEGDPLRFRVILDRAPNADLELRYELLDHNLTTYGAQRGTSPCATGDDYLDFAATSGTLTVTWPHDPLQAVAVPAVTTCDDSVAEPDETLWLRVWVPSGGEAVMEPDGGAVGTIEDDDTPAITVADVSATEGETLEFKVSLMLDGSPVNLAAQVTLDYTIEQASPVSAQQDIDYEPAAGYPFTGGKLTFGPGLTGEQTVQVQLLADNVHTEGDETFVLRLSDADGAIGGLLLADASAVGTILDDPPPLLSVVGFRGPEDSTQSFKVELDMAPRAGDTVMVDYAITGGTGAGQATEDVDYEAAPGSALSGTLSFGAGVTARSVAVTLLPDAVLEGGETLTIALSNAQHAYLDSTAATATGTIDDVDPPLLTVDNPNALEGDAMTFTVTLERGRSGEGVTVNYTVEPKEATECQVPQGTLDPTSLTRSRDCEKGTGDYLPVAPGELKLDAANPTATVSAQTLTDKIAENAETLHLVLSGPMPTHVGLGKAVGVGTIINVNPATVRVNNPRIREGGLLEFEISLVDDGNQPASIRQDVTVEFHTEDRTAGEGSACTAPDADYLAPSGTSVTFAPGGQTEHPVRVQTCPDTRDEDDETVALVLAVDPDNDAAVLGDAEGTGTIINADPPELRIADADAEEGQTMTFAVTLVDSNGVETSTSEVVTVFAATEDGTAHAGADYTAASRLLTIPAGDTSVPFPFEFEVATSLDDINESLETFRVVLSGAGNAKIGRAVAVGTINPRCVDASLDDDNNRPPTITLYDTTVSEGDTYYVPVTFSAPMCEHPQIIRQQISGEGLGTATCGVDFHVGLGPCDPPDEVTVLLAQSLTTVPLAQAGGWGTKADSLDEDDEWFTHRWRWGPDMGPRYQGPGPGLEWVSARVTILDDDDPPRLSVADASAAEGDPVAFSISLDRASGRPVTVGYQTVAATATDGTDYTEVDGTHTFMPGATFLTVYVPTVDDGAGDSGETFLFEVGAPPDPSTPVNAEIVDGVAVGTILEGNLPEMRIYDASADEDTTMFLRVELSEAAAQTVTVDYSTVERSGPRAADEGADYQPVVRQQLEFAPGDTLKFAEVIVNTDTDPEAAETFLVELADPSGAELADSSAVGTINSDVTCYDPTETGAVAPAVTVDSPTAVEGDGQITFTVQLSEPICDYGAVFSIDPAGIFFDNFGSALPNVDFNYSGSSTIVFVPALATEASFTVVLIDDDIDEPDEDIRMSVRSDSDLEHVEAVGTIVDDDQAALSVAGDSGPEGGFLNFVIRLDGPSDRTVTVDYATEDATPPSAAAGTDYRARSGPAVIAAGDLSATVAVFAPQDRLNEDAETFQLRLSNPTGGASLADADAVATGTITDDDDPPSLRVSDASTDEGGTLEFAVTLDAPSGRQVSVPVVTRDGTARAVDGDYVGLSSRDLVFAPGVTLQTVRVRTITDNVVESAERFWLDLGPMGNNTATIDPTTTRAAARSAM